MIGTHYDVPDGHQYSSPVDNPEHLDPSDVDENNRGVHQDDGTNCPHGCGK